MSSGFNVLIDYIPSSPDALSFFSFLYLFSGYIEIDILIEIIHKI